MSPSAILLILANLVPLGGVLFRGWDLATVMLGFWAETATIGVFTVLKMLLARPAPRAAVLFLAPFFCVHFGLFMAVHGALLVAILSEGDIGSNPLTAAPRFVLGSSDLPWFLAATTVSHGFSFVTHFVVGGERDRLPAMRIMAQPYGRVVLQHVTILFGGIATMLLGAPIALLVLLVGAKIAVDVAMHRRSHAATTAAA